MGYRLRVVRRGNAVAVRLPIVVAAAFALLSFSTPAVASTSIRYGMQDDAWLRYGPGTLEERLDRVEHRKGRGVRLNGALADGDLHAPRDSTDTLAG